MEFPELGFGTWQIEGRECEEAVRDALEVGYRHIDTAWIYENEQHVGRGLKAIDRGEVWLTTKVWMDDAEPERVRASCERSLQLLDTDYLDLLLHHWPNPDVPVERTVEALTALREEGKVREIGLSNAPPGLLLRALDAGPVFTNQVEYHPFLGQERLLEVCAEHDLTLTAYSPLAQGKAADDPTLQEIGEAHGKSAGQVAIRWLMEQPRVITIPKASTHERRVENFDVFDFELSHDERARIDALPKDQRESSPSFAPDWDS
ncbi:MAG TPA: aldo/keto reductase [Thermoleophilaceae bacterium]|nr:aldo/keto reductase [Thermoleophilaceae bacterium]